MPSSESELGFFSLPPEIRCLIYDFVLVRETQIIPHARPAIDPPLTTSILRTCKQIHREASPSLYSNNAFLMFEAEPSFEWLDQIGFSNIYLLKTIRLRTYVASQGRERDYWDDVIDRLVYYATGFPKQTIYMELEDKLNF